ncbi:MAG: hypothetical protein V3V00_00900 [Saprospiraceae bacterium]
MKIRENCNEKQKALVVNDQIAQGLEQKMNNLIMEYLNEEKYYKSLTFQKSLHKYKPTSPYTNPVGIEHLLVKDKI